MHSQRFLDLRNFCNTFWLCQWKIGNFKSSSSPINMRQKEWIQHWLHVWIKGQRSIVVASATLPKPRQSWSCGAVKLWSRSTAEYRRGSPDWLFLKWGCISRVWKQQVRPVSHPRLLHIFLSRGITTPSLQLPLQNVQKKTLVHKYWLGDLRTMQTSPKEGLSHKKYTSTTL